LRDYRRNTVPKRRISEAAARQRSAAAGVFHTGEECAVKASAVDQNAAFDGVLDEGQNSVEMAAKKPVADFSAVAACEEELFGKKKRASGGTLPGKPEDCDAPELGKPVSKSGEGMREVFVGGLDRDAKEADVRAALGKAGEITEVRMVMDAKANKNKGFCFVSYREAAQARKAIEEFGHVKVVPDTLRSDFSTFRI
jgi:RNA recognition motif-containing protein